MLKSGLKCAVLAAAFPILGHGAAPTFTFGPASNYAQPPTITAAPKSGDLLLLPTAMANQIPPNGVDMFFGPDLQESLNDAAESHCGTGVTQECADGLFEALDENREYTIQSRQALPLLAFEVGAAVVAWMVALWQDRINSADRVPAFVHMPSSDLAQLQSQTESVFIFQTASGAAATTITAPLVSVSPTPATITTLTVDTNGHHSGDVVIALPTDSADLLRQLIAKGGAPDKCGGTSEKRDIIERDDAVVSANSSLAIGAASNAKSSSGGGPDFGAIGDISTWVLPMAAPGQLLDALGLEAAQQLPRLQDAIDQSSLLAVQAATAGLAAFDGVAPGLAYLIAEVVWIAVYDVCVNNVPDLLELVLDESLISDDPVDDEPDEKCPPDSIDNPECVDVACTGVNGICTTGDMQGCHCLETIEVFWVPGDEALWDAGQRVIDALLGLDDSAASGTANVNEGELGCGSQTDMGNPLHFVDLATMDQATNFFCQRRVDEKTKFEPGKVTDDHKRVGLSYNDHANDPVFLAIDWKDSPDCPVADFGADGALDMCKDRLGTIVHNCDTANNQNFYYWKQGGTFFRDCVTWTIRRDGFGGPDMPTTDDSWRPAKTRCLESKECDRGCGSPGKGFCVLKEQTSDQGWCSCNFAP